MYNFIGKNGDSFEAYWVIHGHPRGEEDNTDRTDPPVFRQYLSKFHTPESTLDYTTPGETFIKKEVPGLTGGFAYTFARTGIYGNQGDRPGTNYGAVTVIMDDMDEKSTEQFENDLKEWFIVNILNKFTYKHPGKVGWRKWDMNADKLFKGAYDEKLKNSIESVIKPYLEITALKSGNTKDIDKYKVATERLQAEIERLEQQRDDLNRQIAKKRRELANM